MKYHEVNPDLEQVAALLPPVVQELIRLIGYINTQTLICKVGGVTFPVGKGVRKGGNRRRAVLTELLGKDVADKIEKHFASEALYIPRCDAALREWRNRQFIAEYEEMLQGGESARFTLMALCPRYGVTDRWAQKLLASKRDDAPSSQLDLL
jgi:hypothetical protein